METDLSNYIITPPKNYSTVNLLNEQKWAVFCIGNPISSFDLGLDKILNYDCRKILETTQYLYNNNLVVTPDEIASIFQTKNINIPFMAIKSLIEQFKDFSNITFIKQQINDNYISYTTIPKIVKDVYETLNTGNCLDRDKIKDLAHDLLKTTFDNERNHVLKDTQELKHDYIKILNERKQGIAQHSLGFKTLDKHVTRPGAPQEMTFVFSLKGTGKSIFVKNIELALINKQVPVLSLNLEMSLQSTLDRILSTEGNISLNDLQLQHMPENTEKVLQQTLNRFALNKYYLYSDESEMNLSDLDLYIQKAKLRFKEKHVLKNDDEYMVVTIDLIEQIHEFSVAKSSYEIKTAVNKLHSICKKHKVHFILVGQANEDRLRQTTIKKLEDCDFYKLNMSDIWGSDSWAGRCRVCISLVRPKFMKLMLFPEKSDEISLDKDILNVACVKSNDGPLFFERFVFGDNFQIYPYRDEISPSI